MVAIDHADSENLERPLLDHKENYIKIIGIWKLFPKPAFLTQSLSSLSAGRCLVSGNNTAAGANQNSEFGSSRTVTTSVCLSDWFALITVIIQHHVCLSDLPHTKLH